jgi:hypothetical protein
MSYAVSGDLVFENFTTAQSNQQPTPPTIASAATIAPTTRFTFLTGTTQVATITPPTTGYCEVVLCFTNASPGAFATSGNILTGYQPVQNRPITLYYDPSSTKWYVMSIA